MSTLDEAIQSNKSKQVKTSASSVSGLERGILMSIVRNVTGTLTREIMRSILRSLKGKSSDRRQSY